MQHANALRACARHFVNMCAIACVCCSLFTGRTYGTQLSRGRARPTLEAILGRPLVLKSSSQPATTKRKPHTLAFETGDVPSENETKLAYCACWVCGCARACESSARTGEDGNSRTLNNTFLCTIIFIIYALTTVQDTFDFWTLFFLE